MTVQDILQNKRESFEHRVKVCMYRSQKHFKEFRDHYISPQQPSSVKCGYVYALTAIKQLMSNFHK